MIRTHTLTTLLIFVYVSSYSQYHNNTQDLLVTNQVTQCKSVDVLYNNIDLQDGDSLLSTMVYYDEYARIKKRITYEFDREFIDERYAYDKSNNVLRSDAYDAIQKKRLSHKEYKYNDQNLLQEVRHIKNKKKIAVIKSSYNKSNLIQKKEYHDNLGKAFEVFYHYDQNGIVKRKDKKMRSDGFKKISETYSYNRLGQVLKAHAQIIGKKLVINKYTYTPSGATKSIRYTGLQNSFFVDPNDEIVELNIGDIYTYKYSYLNNGLTDEVVVSLNGDTQIHKKYFYTYKKKDIASKAEKKDGLSNGGME